MAISFVCREGETGVENNFDAVIFPNPTSGTFTLQFNQKLSSPVNIEILNMIGNVIEKTTTDNETVVFNQNSLAKGIYLLRIQNNDALLVKKITVVK